MHFRSLRLIKVRTSVNEQLIKVTIVEVGIKTLITRQLIKVMIVALRNLLGVQVSQALTLTKYEEIKGRKYECHIDEKNTLILNDRYMMCIQFS